MTGGIEVSFFGSVLTGGMKILFFGNFFWSIFVVQNVTGGMEVSFLGMIDR